MKNITYKEALEKAKQYDADLRADDPRFGRFVNVISNDYRTNLHYNNAFAVKDGCWYYVFTEHYGYYVFHEGDDYVFQYQRCEIDKF